MLLRSSGLAVSPTGTSVSRSNCLHPIRLLRGERCSSFIILRTTHGSLTSSWYKTWFKTWLTFNDCRCHLVDFAASKPHYDTTSRSASYSRSNIRSIPNNRLSPQNLVTEARSGCRINHPTRNPDPEDGAPTPHINAQISNINVQAE